MAQPATKSPSLRRSARNIKRNLDGDETLRDSPKIKRKRIGSTPNTPIKQEPTAISPNKTPISPDTTTTTTSSSPQPTTKASLLQARKLKSFSTHATTSPFPSFPRPTPRECTLAHHILSSLHGARLRPETLVAPESSAGCGASSSVLDALVRTILSQNTSDKNSTRAKLSMDEVYGGSDRWDAIVSGGQPRLQRAIQSGGLSVTKSKVILSILTQVKAKYGIYSLDHLFQASNQEAMQELLSFHGVGPKTASCVLLFCLRRESFAVDTHVYRITGLLGWRPMEASREEAQAHLNARIPDEEKYGLHVLLVTHGKQCGECKAGGKNLGKCALRRAFREGRIKGKAGEEMKQEELEHIKKEDVQVG
ncbi:Putative DNA glycosylase [Cladobotryum mycophilum]|uniref:DNA glycosylase n=1 Tax=Cladobotryum mycophilum TaxID=491253 RepID=A0ABR0SV57_9HYPO